jgi:hypothetical protein
MNYYIKICGFIILGYVALWVLFMLIMSIKLYFNLQILPNLSLLLQYINNLFYI